jgi:hypothetical protein
MTPELKKAIDTLREKFDAYLIAEIREFGGIPIPSGRCASENAELREAIARLLETFRTTCE